MCGGGSSLCKSVDRSVRVQYFYTCMTDPITLIKYYRKGEVEWGGLLFPFPLPHTHTHPPFWLSWSMWSFQGINLPIKSLIFAKNSRQAYIYYANIPQTRQRESREEDGKQRKVCHCYFMHVEKWRLGLGATASHAGDTMSMYLKRNKTYEMHFVTF